MTEKKRTVTFTADAAAVFALWSLFYIAEALLEAITRSHTANCYQLNRLSHQITNESFGLVNIRK